MPYCVNCKCEYIEGYTVCADCGALLVDKCPDPLVMEDRTDSPFVFLCSLAGGIETDMTVFLLEGNAIPVMQKRREGGQYLEIYMGTSFYGVDIYVPKSLFMQASEILAAKPMVAQEETLEDEDSVDEEFSEFKEKESKKKRFKMWGIILFMFPGFILVGLIWLIIYYFNR